MQNFIIARFCSPRNEPPLAASDGVHTFTYDSVQRRLPLIAEAIIENNPDYPQPLVTSLRTLAGEIAAGEPLRALEAAPDSWESELVPCLAESQTWFTAPWFLVENYFYKQLRRRLRCAQHQVMSFVLSLPTPPLPASPLDIRSVDARRLALIQLPTAPTALAGRCLPGNARRAA
jgi:hypothetical protein